MHRILLVLGLVVVAAGVAMVGFGMPNNGFGIGNTLIASGTTAIVGGFILVGMSVAVRQLQEVVRALDARSTYQRPGGDASWADMPCLLYTSPSPRDGLLSRMPSSA